MIRVFGGFCPILSNLNYPKAINKGLRNSSEEKLIQGFYALTPKGRLYKGR